MTATDLVETIFLEQRVTDKNGTHYPLQASVSRQEGAFIQGLIYANKPQQSLEIGFAYGISSLFICAALAGTRHTVIDPSQRSVWHSVGITNLERAGFRNFDLIEKPSELALPELLAEGRRFDFVFIDGWHTFDHTLLDFFYANRMLQVGGIIVIDDAEMPAVNRVIRYATAYPSYRVAGTVGEVSRNRRIYERLAEWPAAKIAALLPSRIRTGIFSDNLRLSDRNLGIQGSMVALRKVSEDERSWNWYKSF